MRTLIIKALPLCCFLLLLNSSMAETTLPNFCSGHSAHPPPLSTVNETITNQENSASSRNLLVTKYQDVLDEVIEYQSMSWLYGVGYRNIDEVATNSCPKPVSSLTMQPAYKKRRISTDSSNSTSNTNSTSRADINAATDGFIQDDEDDIGKYFDDLLWLCRSSNSNDTDAENASTRMAGCWNLLYSLVHDARCTTRMDSRTTCHRNKSLTAPTTTSKQDVWTMLDNHHSSNNNDSPDDDETPLNIVIVGAGPVGLLLASALSQLQIPGMLHDDNHSSIRVTVFENRASAPGMKHPYTRGWGYAPDVTHLEGTADERILALFHLLEAPAEPGEDEAWKNIFSIPINVLETLLLLSNRQQGVQFIYGEDITEFMPDFQQRIPNLLVLDASGHRLNTLERGASCQKAQNDDIFSSPVNATISEFHAPPLDDAGEWLWIPPAYFPSMKENGHVPDIARQNNCLVYPVHASTGQPFASYWMHVHDLPGDCASDAPLKQNLYHSTDDVTSNLCKACRERSPAFDNRVDQNVGKTRSWLRGQSLMRGDTRNELSDEDEEEAVDKLAQLVEYRGLLGSPAGQTSSDTLCSALCVPNSYYDGTDCYREDVQEQMKDPNDNRSGPWFTARLVNFNFSEKQAMTMMKILETHGYATNPAGMPVSELPLSLMAQDPILQENNLLEVLISVAACAGPKHPTITIFLLRPYLYQEALVKPSVVESLLQTRDDATTCAKNGASATDSSSCALQEPFQMLRMGDSLMSGDVTLNSGLSNHVMMIRAWMCTLRGAEVLTCF